MTVSRICRREVDLVDLNESAWAAAERMLQRAVDSLIVLDRDRHPIGIVTEWDLVVKVIAAEKRPRTTRVRDIMTAPVRTILDSTSLPQALSLIRGDGLRHLSVVDGEGKLVGILTLDDILSYLTRESGDFHRRTGPGAPNEAAPSEKR